jgi:hypothetical protein
MCVCVSRAHVYVFTNTYATSKRKSVHTYEYKYLQNIITSRALRIIKPMNMKNMLDISILGNKNDSQGVWFVNRKDR